MNAVTVVGRYLAADERHPITEGVITMTPPVVLPQMYEIKAVTPEWNSDGIVSFTVYSGATPLVYTYTEKLATGSRALSLTIPANATGELFVGDLAGWSAPAGVAVTRYPVLDASGGRSRGSRTIVIGDSIDQLSDLWDYYSAGSIFSALCIMSNQKVKWLGNAGVGGNTTAQVLARVQTDAIAYNPGVVIIGGGVTNDHGQGVSPAVSRANLTAIRDALWAAGITVVARNVPPCDNAGIAPFDTVAARRSAIQQHNAWLRSWAAASGIPMLDYYAPLVNEASGGYLPGYSSDGVHPTSAAQLVVAQAVINAGLPPCFTGTPQLTTAVGDGADLLAGTGLFLGAISGGVPAGWDHYGDAAATVSVVTDTAVPGNWVQLVGGGAGIHVIESSPIDGKWAVGDTIEFACRVQKSGVADSNVRIKLTSAVGGNGSEVIRVEPAAGTRAISGVAVGRVVVPAGGISGYIEIIASPGETVKVSQVTVTNLTALGIV